MQMKNEKSIDFLSQSLVSLALLAASLVARTLIRINVKTLQIE